MLRLPPHVRAQIEQHGREAYPLECCGFIVGALGPPRTATGLRRLVNRAALRAHERFEIDPLDWIRTDRELQEHEQVIGVYHSHPDHAPHPSALDRAEALEGLSYVIVSVHRGRAAGLRSWVLKPEAGQFLEERVEAS